MTLTDRQVQRIAGAEAGLRRGQVPCRAHIGLVDREHRGQVHRQVQRGVQRLMAVHRQVDVEQLLQHLGRRHHGYVLLEPFAQVHLRGLAQPLGQGQAGCRGTARNA